MPEKHDATSVHRGRSMAQFKANGGSARGRLPGEEKEEGRRASSLRHIDQTVIAALNERLPVMTAECIQNTFGISANTWLKLRKGMPIRRSVAERLLDRVRADAADGHVYSRHEL